MNIVVFVRCAWCMVVRKEWDATQGVVFVPSTLKKYAEMQCEHCDKIGMEIYIGERPAIIAHE
jgi:hypothetical protein